MMVPDWFMPVNIEVHSDVFIILGEKISSASIVPMKYALI